MHTRTHWSSPTYIYTRIGRSRPLHFFSILIGMDWNGSEVVFGQCGWKSISAGGWITKLHFFTIPPVIFFVGQPYFHAAAKWQKSAIAVVRAFWFWPSHWWFLICQLVCSPKPARNLDILPAAFFIPSVSLQIYIPAASQPDNFILAGLAASQIKCICAFFAYWVGGLPLTVVRPDYTLSKA